MIEPNLIPTAFGMSGGARKGKRARRHGAGDGEQSEGGNESFGMTAFNMEDEKEEGQFDENGHFVWNKEEKRVQEEAWLEDLSEEQIDGALHAKGRQDYRNDQDEETMTQEAANRTLASLLHTRETVLQALQRLGSKKKKNRGTKRKQAQRNGSTPADATPDQTPEEKQQFEQITEAADFLMRIGEVDVYSQIREEFVPEEDLIAQRRATSPGPRVSFADESKQNGASAVEQESKSEENAPAEVMWEYKGADGQIHGPFPTSSFVAWQQQGYFKGDSAVEMRRIAGDAATEHSEQVEAVAEPVKISAEQELLNDFDDSDDDEDQPQSSENKAKDSNDWTLSDSIDFSQY